MIKARWPIVGGSIVLVLSATATSCTSTPERSAPPSVAQTQPPAAADAIVGATAAESKAAFDHTAQRVLEAAPAPNGKSFVEALVGAGFDRTRMQLTPEDTTLGTPADAVFWSVEFPDGCLVGQYRDVEVDPEDHDPSKLLPYSSMIMPATTSGCLFGAPETLT